MNAWNAIVLAADREAENPVAKAVNAPCKSLARLDGETLLRRVLAALEGNRAIDRIVLCGPAESIWRQHPVECGKPLRWLPPAPSPSLSTWNALEALPETAPVLLTTADLGFPKASTFETFCKRSAEAGGDVTVGLAPLHEVRQRFPSVRRTALRFADGTLCTCNLFAFLTPKGRRIVRFWRRLEQDRKRPWRLIRHLGALTLLRYVSGRLTTTELARQVERRLGTRVRFVILNDPDAAIDIDTPQDLALVKRALQRDK